MLVNKHNLILTTIISSLIVSGCTPKPYKEATQNITNTQQQIQDITQQAQTTAPPVVNNNGYYIDTNPISLNKPPAWLKQNVQFHSEQIPLNLLMKRLLRYTPTVVNYAPDVNKDELVSLNYRGPLKGALDEIAAETGDHYQTSTHTIDWSALITKTLDISFMPGSSNYLIGQLQEQQNTQQNNQQNTGQINDQQFSNLEAQLSIWKDMEHTLNDLKSKTGKVEISEATTTVTVHDHPANVAAMTAYIKHLNRELSREVLIKVQVLQLQLDKQFNLGINWNLIINALNTKFNLMGALASSTNVVANNIISRNADSALATLQIGEDDGSHALIEALGKQGKLSIVTQPQVVTMNDQIASIKITENTGYIESVNSSFTENYVTTSITPGTITDGFTLYLLPRITNNAVYMQISSTLSNLVRLDKESTVPPSDETENHNSSSSSSSSQQQNNQQQYQAIQVPTTTQKSFNQRSVVEDRHTLVIAGFKNVRNEANSASLFGIEPLGGKGSESNNTETVVLITPIIIPRATDG